MTVSNNFATWIKEDDGLEGGVLVVVDLNVLERLHQLVQHPVGYPADLRLRTVPVDHAAVACRDRARRSGGRGGDRCVCVCVCAALVSGEFGRNSSALLTSGEGGR